MLGSEEQCGQRLNNCFLHLSPVYIYHFSWFIPLFCLAKVRKWFKSSAHQHAVWRASFGFTPSRGCHSCRSRFSSRNISTPIWYIYPFHQSQNAEGFPSHPWQVGELMHFSFQSILEISLHTQCTCMLFVCIHLLACSSWSSIHVVLMDMQVDLFVILIVPYLCTVCHEILVCGFALYNCMK